MNIPLSESEYGSHKELRKKFIYMDTLVNNEVWSDSLVTFGERIQKYLHERSEHGLVSDNSSKMLGISEHRITEPVFTTIVSDIIHYNISMNIGTYIKEHYEHYKPVYKKNIPVNKTSDVTDVEKIIKYINLNKVLLSKLRDNFKTNIMGHITQEGISYYESYLQNPEGKKVDKITNISLDDYGIYASTSGYDISKNVDPNIKQSLSFVTSSILGWNSTSLEERCVGSPSQFGSILIDIMFKKIRVSDSVKTITDNEKNNCEYLWNLGKNFYEPILSMKMDNIQNNNNPFQIGIINYEYKRPEMNAFWCIWNMLQTPFYDRSKIQPKSINIPLDKILYYKPVRYGVNIRIERSEPIYDVAFVSEMKKAILQDLSGNENANKFSNKTATAKSCLLSDFVKIATNINKPLNQNNLDIQSITRIVKILENVDDKKWFLIISQGISILYLNLILAFDTNWDDIKTSSTMIDNIKFPLSRKSYLVQDDKKHTTYYEIDNRGELIENSYVLFDKYISNLKDIFGNDDKNIMGGLSLKGNNPFHIQRLGKTITYPGDTIVLNQIQKYISLLDNDLSKIQNILNISFDNIQTKYWYRDILKWVDTMFYIFKPVEQYGNSPKTELEVKTGFAKAEQIIKILQSKKIEYIKKIVDYSYQTNISNDIDVLEINAYYIQRQINIIMYILDNILLSWWASDNPSRTKGDAPAFDPVIFNSQYSLMKLNIDNYINDTTLNLSSKYTTPVLEYLQKLKSVLHVSTSQKAPLIDEKSNIIEISTNLSVWESTFKMLYALTNSSYEKDVKDNFRIYLPVTKKGILCLFNIGNFIMNKKINNSSDKNKSWLTYEDLKTSEFKYDIFIIITDKKENITDENKWIEYTDKWFIGMTEENKIQNPQMVGMYLFFTNQVVLQNLVKSKVTSPKMIYALKQYMSLSNTQKRQNKRNVKFTSVENITSILNKVVRDKYKI